METVQLINPKGRVITVDKETADALLASDKPFRVVVSPKQKYYPQYDTSIPESKRAVMTEVQERTGELDDYLDGVEWL